MDKHEAMVIYNKKRSNEKVKKALSAIKKMVQEDQQVIVSELVKRTKLSRSFFYNNPEVKDEIDKAHKLQEGKSFTHPQKAIIDKAMDKEIELLKRKLTEKDDMIDDLKEENAKLKKALKGRALKTINSL